jgi:hypothetical protein
VFFVCVVLFSGATFFVACSQFSYVYTSIFEINHSVVISGFFMHRVLILFVVAVHMIIKQALIDEGADPLVIDYQGNNVFTVLAKNSHLWTLNYVYQIIW